ncbi:MAG TPA: hypothetical protein VGD94_17155 [Vicinamibacterales bacterium]
MQTPVTTLPPPRPTWRELADEQAALEILELEDRVAELQQHATDITFAAVAVLHVAEKRIGQFKTENAQLRDENRALRDELRSLRSVRSENHERRAA